MRKQGVYLVILLGVWCLCSQGAFAQEQTGVSMKPVVVTATKTEHSLGETTADVSVVTREQIEQMPANSVIDVMRTMPGVTVDSARSFYGTSTQNKIIIRGMGGDDVTGRVLVLMDGLPVLAPGSNIFGWDSIDLNAVERIEVVRGPASALYGSNAMGGVINIITRKPTEKGFKTTIGSKYGRYNAWENKLYHTGNLGQFSYAISGKALNADGFSVRPKHSPTASSNQTVGKDDDDHLENYSGMVTLRYAFDKTADISLSGDMSSFKNTGRYTFFDNFTQYSNKHQGIATRLHKDFGMVDSSLSMRADFTQSDYDTAYSYGSPTKKGIVGNDAPAEIAEYSWDQSNTFALGENHLVTMGVAGSYGKFDREMNYFVKDRYRQKGGTQLNLAAFMQDEISLYDGVLTLLPGIRYDYWRSAGYDQDTLNNAHPEKIDYNAVSDVRFSPKLGLRVDPWDNLVVFRSNYGEAFRVASLDDRFGGFISNDRWYRSNPHLQPETSKTWDVGVDIHPTENLSLSVTGYKTWADHYIANVPQGYTDGYLIYEKENIDKVVITGLEANVQYQVSRALKVFAEGTALRPEIRSGKNQGRELHNVPLQKASVGFTFVHPEWCTLNASATWMGRIWQGAENNPDIAEGHFWLGQFKVSRRFDYEQYWVEPFVEMQGITTKNEIRYTNSSRIPSNQLFVGLEAGF